MKKKLSMKRLILYIGTALVFLVAAFPLFYLFLTSVKPAGMLMDVPPAMVFRPTLDHYKEVIIGHKYYRYYANSLIISISASVLTLILGSMMAFATTRFRFFGKKILPSLVVITRMYMPVSTLLPIYMVGQFFGLLDTYLYFILVYTSLQLPLTYYILTGFFADLPPELVESAELDGCSTHTLFFKIAFPLALPGIIAAGILIFVFNWNEFLFGLVLSSTRVVPAPVALSAFSESEGSVLWGQLSALGMSMSIPVILVMVFLSKYLIKGILSGAVKG